MYRVCNVSSVLENLNIIYSDKYRSVLTKITEV